MALASGCPPVQPTVQNPPPLPPPPEGGCGDIPELPFVCADGEIPCDCITGGDGLGQWRCTDCEDGSGGGGVGGGGGGGGITGDYCDQNPDATVCAKDAACIACHGLQTAAGGTGIENPHAWSYVACVDCHGGVGRDEADPTRRLSQDEAHVPMPESMRVSVDDLSTPQRDKYGGKYLALAGVERLPGGAEWLRFRNPGDLRVVDNTCSANGCHAGMGETVRRSTMASAVGKLDGLLSGLGYPRDSTLAEALGDDSFGKHLATYGAANVEDPDWDMDSSPPGSVPALTELVGFDREIDRPFGTYTEIDLHKESVNKICGTCHLGTSGKNNQYGNFRASGCTGCHMAYDWSGQSQSGDPMIPKGEPTYPDAYTQISYPERPHPPRHVIRRNPSAQDCLACHTGSMRTVFQFMGIRVDENRDLTKANNIDNKNLDFRYSNLIDNGRDPAAKLKGFTQDQLIEFEDLNNDGEDDTPPDVHYQAGLECVDCHNTIDMHGDGKIYSRQFYQVNVRCNSCHGTLEYAADPDSGANPINVLWNQSGRIARKNLFKFDRAPAYGELGYPAVTQPGIWLRTKTGGEWRYVSQVRWGAQWDANSQDCIDDGRKTDPRTGGFICNPKASVFHGRWEGLNQANGDFENGVGTRPGVEVVAGADGATSNVRYGFSHIGEEVDGPDEEPAGGLDCIACHAPNSAQKFGNHFGLIDVDSTGRRLYDWDRTTGVVTMGAQGWFDFTFNSQLDQMLGVTQKGKIGWFTPTRLKMFRRNTVLNPNTQQALEFFAQNGVGDTGHSWKTYRDRVGFGNLIQNAQAGVEDAPGYAAICLETGGFCDQDTRKNINGGLGADTMGPHATQLRSRDCTTCHLDQDGGGIAKISAKFGWNPNGHDKTTLRYLAAIDTVRINRGDNYITNNGFVIADDGIQHRLDYMVDENTGYPLVWSPLVRMDDGRDGRIKRGYETWDPDASGPIDKQVIDLLKRVRVNNVLGAQGQGE
ncbi:MAG: hypothetical protein IT382_24815 [Deltaproteobacteria bacterium]|nr:hypothetical protein [Deltaproteobacteria bacterium]